MDTVTGQETKPMLELAELLRRAAESGHRAMLLMRQSLGLESDKDGQSLAELAGAPCESFPLPHTSRNSSR